VPETDEATSPAEGVPRTAEGPWRPGVLGWSCIVFGVALVVRAALLLELAGSPIFELRMGDGRVYHLWALEIAGGDWIGQRVFYQAPFYPYFLAVVYRLADDSVLVVRGVQIVLGAAGCGLLTHAGWRLLSPPVGIGAGLLLAFYAPALFADVTIQKSVLDLFFVSAVLALMASIDARPRVAAAAGLGAVMGALVLTREHTLVFLVVLLPWLLGLPDRPRAARLAWAGTFCAALACVLLPVAIRNWSLSGDFHLTTSQFGHNFFIGNNPAADGTYHPLLYGRGDPLVERDDAVRLVADALGREPTPAEVSRYYTDRALDYIRSDPGDWLRLLGRKLVLALNRVELVDTEDQYTHAEYAFVLRATGSVLHFGLLAPLACLGAWVAWPRRRRLWPLYAMVVVYGGSLLLFYIFGRYRLPLVPILALAATAGCVGLPGLVRRERPRALALGGGAVLAVAIVANWPVLDTRYMRSVSHYNIGNELVAAGDVEAGMHHYALAIELYHDNAVANHNLGVLLAMRGERERARRHLEQALRINPSYAEARFNLARLLADTGQPRAAVESYRLGLAVEPDRAEVHVELGRLLDDLGEHEAAGRHYRRALEIAPSDAAAREALGEPALP
jgi:tetratricopeptide (TPR) repeat protein